MANAPRNQKEIEQDAIRFAKILKRNPQGLSSNVISEITGLQDSTITMTLKRFKNMFEVSQKEKNKDILWRLVENANF